MPLRAYAVLGAGVLVVSTAAILIRYAHAQGVPSLAIAAWRLSFAALLLAPVAALRAAPQLRALAPAQWALALVSGVFLGLHFATWIVSLEYTSVASSVALVTTNPIWIALFSWVFLRERLSAGMLAAIAWRWLAARRFFWPMAAARRPAPRNPCSATPWRSQVRWRSAATC